MQSFHKLFDTILHHLQTNSLCFKPLNSLNLSTQTASSVSSHSLNSYVRDRSTCLQRHVTSARSNMSFEVYDATSKEKIDIIFVLVHGLDDDKNAFKNNRTKESMAACLYLTFPRSRIIQYEYPNNSFAAVSKMNPLPLNDRGVNFLQGLLTHVKDTKCNIHFMGHSMGGLVIKQCLWTASQSNDNRYKKIFQRTKSVAFYATPHCGSYLADIYSTYGITTKAVDDLKVSIFTQPV